eukprot:2570526-Amphidinium_carterae.1
MEDTKGTCGSHHKLHDKHTIGTSIYMFSLPTVQKNKNEPLTVFEGNNKRRHVSRTNGWTITRK